MKKVICSAITAFAVCLMFVYFKRTTVGPPKVRNMPMRHTSSKRRYFQPPFAVEDHPSLRTESVESISDREQFPIPPEEKFGGSWSLVIPKFSWKKDPRRVPSIQLMMFSAVQRWFDNYPDIYRHGFHMQNGVPTTSKGITKIVQQLQYSGRRSTSSAVVVLGTSIEDDLTQLRCSSAQLQESGNRQRDQQHLFLVTPFPNANGWQNKYKLAHRLRLFQEDPESVGCVSQPEALDMIVPPAILFPDDCDKPHLWEDNQQQGHAWITKEPNIHRSRGLTLTTNLSQWMTNMTQQGTNPCQIARQGTESARSGQSVTSAHQTQNRDEEEYRTQMSKLVVQAVVPPFLYQRKYKLTLASYVLILSSSPHWVIAVNPGTSPHSFESYDPNNLTEMSVFTNLDRQKEHPHFLKTLRETKQVDGATNEWGMLGYTLVPDIASQWGMSEEAVSQHLVEEHIRIVRLGFLANKKYIKRQCGAFMFMRWDLLFAADGTFRLVELNNTPDVGFMVFERHDTATANFSGRRQEFHRIRNGMDMVMRIQRDPSWRPPKPGQSPQYTFRDLMFSPTHWVIAYDEAADMC
eukprot:TRINITY_DN61224_c0_g1_i2.p1 TRINITY_DN61224_c0_g1~~TRINITY_DN61224_c0_g1_i2.p1  ORF type:complete len:576 (-),score=60.47 TRINITY_DN61224_c0_g1_i2:81-1808(-)